MLVYTTLDNIAENALRSGFTAMLYYMFSIMYYCVSAESYTQLVHTFIRLYDVCLFLFNDILRTLQRIKHFARLLGFIYDIVVVIIIVIFLIQRTQLLAVLNIMKLVSLHTHWLLFFSVSFVVVVIIIIRKLAVTATVASCHCVDESGSETLRELRVACQNMVVGQTTHSNFNEVKTKQNRKRKRNKTAITSSLKRNR